MPVSPAQLVSEFLRAFMSGETDKARAMVRSDFVFRAPMHSGAGGPEAYFAGAEQKAKFIRSFCILNQWESGGEVSTIYELDLGTSENNATMPICEWHSVHEEKIASAFMVFDTNAAAVQAMRGALQHPH